MVGCDTLDELFAYTKNSFRNLIREDERQSAEASIWEQIEAGSVNDYVCYHLQKADGSYITYLTTEESWKASSTAGCSTCCSRIGRP